MIKVLDLKGTCDESNSSSAARPLTFYACYEPSSLNSFLFALNQTERSLLLMLLALQPHLSLRAAEIFSVYTTFVLSVIYDWNLTLMYSFLKHF